MSRYLDLNYNNNGLTQVQVFLLFFTLRKTLMSTTHDDNVNFQITKQCDIDSRLNILVETVHGEHWCIWVQDK